jgi:hypothetical protein
MPIYHRNMLTSIGSLVFFNAQVETFCLAVGGKSQSWGSHIAAVCHVDWLNLTLASWFL